MLQMQQQQQNGAMRSNKLDPMDLSTNEEDQVPLGRNLILKLISKVHDAYSDYENEFLKASLGGNY